jgi:hypothetical protein
MGPPPRSLAAEANGCFMVRVRHGPNRIQGCGARDAPDSGLPSDQSKHASTIGKQSDAIKLDTDIPIQGCVKTSARFHTSLFRSRLRGLRAFRVEKIAKNLALLDRLKIFAEFYAASIDPFARSGRLESTLTGRCGSRPWTSQSGEGDIRESRVGAARIGFNLPTPASHSLLRR